MADNGSSANAVQMPPPQPNAGAPGFEASKNAQGIAPNQPPPLQIPHNNNPIPTSVTSPMSGADLGLMSPATAARRAAPEPNKRALYVGGLDQRVTEDILRQIFETTGHVQSVKIIPDKNVSLLIDRRSFSLDFG
jgi:nucleolysin TIA-1/TIAR